MMGTTMANTTQSYNCPPAETVGATVGIRAVGMVEKRVAAAS